jgi:hypothetical protein
MMLYYTVRQFAGKAASHATSAVEVRWSIDARIDNDMARHAQAELFLDLILRDACASFRRV